MVPQKWVPHVCVQLSQVHPEAVLSVRSLRVSRGRMGRLSQKRNSSLKPREYSRWFSKNKTPSWTHRTLPTLKNQLFFFWKWRNCSSFWFSGFNFWVRYFKILIIIQFLPKYSISTAANTAWSWECDCHANSEYQPHRHMYRKYWTCGICFRWWFRKIFHMSSWMLSGYQSQVVLICEDKGVIICLYTRD